MSYPFRRFDVFEPQPPSIHTTSYHRSRTLYDFPFSGFSSEEYSSSDYLNFHSLDLLSSNPYFLDFPYPHCSFIRQTTYDTLAEESSYRQQTTHHRLRQPYLHRHFLEPFYDDSITNIVHVDGWPSSSTFSRQIHRSYTNDPYLRGLCDRVSILELGLDKAFEERNLRDRKYTWTTDIKGDHRKHKLTVDVKGSERHGGDRKYKWTAEIKGGKLIDKIKGYGRARSVEIEDPHDPRIPMIKQAVGKRSIACTSKGKKKILSPQDAAMTIQTGFRAYLSRKTQSLKSIRDMAIAKAKMRELRSLFNNFSYRRVVARDPEERQRFSERIVVLILTVEAIEGSDPMIRAARREIVDELECMLDAVDPQPTAKLAAMRRRKFDMPEAGIQKEIEAGVAEVVQMLDSAEKSGDSFEVSL
ncbi:BAG domain [Dillenia turbinata]|uniref:BAG domain n=1 Tax=Dillenia turbinata TaxID=194707 RepID=A0AAN8UQD5_9MAGN